MKQNRTERLISVIVPIYNVEKYIEECLNSILAQTYSNIEVICIDDKSTDLSGNICEQYAVKDSRIHVVHKKRNEGLSVARNMGLRFAHGEYITFIDSDDWVDKHYLEYLYKGMNRYDADIAQCGYVRILDSMFEVRSMEYTKHVDVITGRQALRKLYATSSPHASIEYTIVCNKLYKRDVIIGLKFPEGRIYEDQFFTYQCFERVKKIYVTDEKLYNYRININSITRQNYGLCFQDEIMALSEQIQYFKNRDKKFMSIIVARIEPLCVFHYKLSEFEDDSIAKRNAYKYALKYLIPYLRNRKICWNNKFKIMLFAISPAIFIYSNLDVKFNAKII